MMVFWRWLQCHCPVARPNSWYWPEPSRTVGLVAQADVASALAAMLLFAAKCDHDFGATSQPVRQAQGPWLLAQARHPSASLMYIILHYSLSYVQINAVLSSLDGVQVGDGMSATDAPLQKLKSQWSRGPTLHGLCTAAVPSHAAHYVYPSWHHRH